MAERKQAPSTVNIAIHARRAFYGGLLARDIESLLRQVQRPKRPTRVPRPYSMAEMERLLTVGTQADLRAEALEPMSKGTGQNIFYRAVQKAGLPDRGGIHCLRHSCATHCLENNIEITVVQKLLGHASFSTTAHYLHVRAERLAQIQSPLGLLDLSSPLTRS